MSVACVRDKMDPAPVDSTLGKQRQDQFNCMDNAFSG